jgi:hypothetical protein
MASKGWPRSDPQEQQRHAIRAVEEGSMARDAQWGTVSQMIPCRRRSVPKEEAMAIFATAPIFDADDLRGGWEAFLADVRNGEFDFFTS